jgi:propanol-preferring alcohol dehydrogenase
MLDAAIIFAPAGELVIDALEVLDKGGTVAMGGIYSSPVPPIEYPLIYRERVIRSVTNSTRRDAADLLRLAAAIPITTEIEVFGLEQANDALIALKHDGIRGAAVLQVALG